MRLPRFMGMKCEWAKSLETLGDRHPDTLISISNCAYLLRELGELQEAAVVLGDAPSIACEVLGEHHERTLVLQALAASM